MSTHESGVGATNALTHYGVLDHSLAHRGITLGRGVANVVAGLVSARVNVVAIETENLLGGVRRAGIYEGNKRGGREADGGRLGGGAGGEEGNGKSDRGHDDGGGGARKDEEDVGMG